MKRETLRIVLLVLLPLFVSSCATLSGSGVGRVKHYTIDSNALPEVFDGFTIAFLSDFHFPSKFTEKRLRRVVNKLSEISPDVILLGGDYAPSPLYARSLFSAFSSLKTKYGIYAVLGNHDKRWSKEIEAAMDEARIELLSDEAVYITENKDSLCVAGIADSFRLTDASASMLASVPDSVFTILLAHTPDFSQDASVQCDLVLSGHTHGGQVSLMGLYTPVKNSKYGTCFLRGLNETDNSVPVITTNGIGTSRRKIRFCVPSEIVLVRLRR